MGEKSGRARRVTGQVRERGAVCRAATGKPKLLIMIDTYAIGGPGKLILQFLKNGAEEICAPIVAGFWRGPQGKWQFREALETIGVSLEVLHQRSAFDPSALWGAYRLAREQRVQILESHGYKAHVVCLALNKTLRLPWVAYVHGWTDENLKMRLYHRLEKTLVRFADRIVPVSRDLGARLQLGKAARAKLVHIPNAAEPAGPGRKPSELRRLLGVDPEETLFAVVGRLSPEKGHLYFIEAFQTLVAAGRRVRGVFVGEGPQREALEAALKREGLEQLITLVGYQEDVAPYYRACDLLVLPSLAEGMPMAALEAMMFAKPVLATRVGGIPEVVLDGVTGVLVAPRNAGQLAAALGRMLDDREWTAGLGAAGQGRVEAEFSPAARAGRIAAMYRDLMT